MMKKLFALLLALCMLLGCTALAEEAPVTEAEKVEVNTAHELIYGASTEINGDFAPSAWWTNGATDKLIRDLVHDYPTIATDQGGNLVENKTVLKNLTIEEQEDGSKIFTMTINEGLVYNNGDPITAADYVGYIVFQCSPAAKDLGTSFTTHTAVEGALDYREGRASEISGVRMLDDYTFSVHILKVGTDDTTLFPYFYELSYAAYSPISMKYWFGEQVVVKDDGKGAYAVGMTTDEIKANVEKARYTSDPTVVSCGPYQFYEYDASSKQAILVINPKYAGNFEGQKPSVEKITIVKAEDATWADAMKVGAFNFYDTITSGKDVNAALDMMEDETLTEKLTYNYKYVQFDRAGYGAVFFQCDFGPTQFPAVRQALAHLLDRTEFANTFCQGWGSVVSVPAGPGLWEYQDREEWLNENLDTYPYDYSKAVALLVEDGWVYNADGSEWTEGNIRYKKVTEEEAGTYAGNVTLADGTVLMPLSMEWASSENNPVSELLKVMLAENPDVAKAGVKINQNVMTFSELLNWYYRDKTVDTKYSVPTYTIFNLANGYNAPYSVAYEYTLDPELVAAGWNNSHIYDEELDRLSMDMVYGLSSDQVEEHLDMFCKFMMHWNELLPSMPLYSNVYITMYPEWLEDYEQDSFWNFQQAILYAKIAE